MLTITEVRTNPSKFFARQNEETKNANLAILNYIDHLAKTTSNNIASWDLETLFKDPTNTKKSFEFIKDRNQINKIFFGEVERIKSTPSIGNEMIVSTLKSSIEKVSATRRDARIKELESAITVESRNLTEFSVSISKAIAVIAKHKREIIEINGGNTEDKILSDIQEILQGGFYEFLEVKGTTITFVTKNDVVNEFIKPIAGLDLRVNLGRYKILFDTNTLAMMVKPFERNVVSNGHYHPNVSTSGTICWGNVQGQVNEMLKAFDIKGALLMLASLLSNYTEDHSPYQHLSNFAAVKNEGVPF